MNFRCLKTFNSQYFPIGILKLKLRACRCLEGNLTVLAIQIWWWVWVSSLPRLLFVLDFASLYLIEFESPLDNYGKSFQFHHCSIHKTQYLVSTLLCKVLSLILVSSSRKKLTLSVPEILENSIFVTPIIPRTLNINNLRITSGKSINMHTIWKLIKCSVKNVFLLRQRLLLPFSRYYCSKVRRYYHPPSGVQGAKGLRIENQREKRKLCAFRFR